MIRDEYARFMQTLAVDGVSEGVRKVANLVHDHLDVIQPLGTQQGQRVKRVIQLAQANWLALATGIAVQAVEVAENVVPIVRLKNLSVGPFRGFAREEVFDLDSPLVLIYGPNGTGKSSFCEALEYGLLGNVAEAESKRFRRQEDYLTNAHVGRFTPPVIEGVDAQGTVKPLVANEAQYRFCFVEKNRIDSFSRIAAHAPARQTELIASLFGLDEFNEFVRGFSGEMDGRYIDLIGAKRQQLQEKRLALAGHKQTIETNQAALVDLTAEEIALATQYQPEIAFADFVTELGTDTAPGEIVTLETELQQVTPLQSGVTLQALIDVEHSIGAAYEGLSTKLAELAQASEAVSFKQLYTAVTVLSEASADHCPACKTPLNQVANNPFELAARELEKLEHLSQLEQERDGFNDALGEAIKAVAQILSVATEQIDGAANPNPLRAYRVAKDSGLSWAWWQSLQAAGGDATAWQELQAQVQVLELRDLGIAQIIAAREPTQARLNLLRDYARQALVLQTRRISLEKGILDATTAIQTFDEENQGLINEVEAEQAVIAINQKIAASYAVFVGRLTAYKESLPSQLVADIGDGVVALYNAFNRYDEEHDLLAALKLPLAPGQRIEIAFRNDPNRNFDALHVLSEGHIRCIGLAILLAKNLKEKCPILIFDDPVNAIDDEHRASIRLALFKDDYFIGKQIILACHGNEFFKDTHQLVGLKAAKESESYIFRAQKDEKHIQVSSLARPVNYVLAAGELAANGEFRDALMSARRALEGICTKVWTHYLKHGGGAISVTQRAPGAPIDLRVLADKLACEIRKATFVIKNRDVILASLQSILGPNGQHPHWVYLNKGTHEEEDRDEFDQVVVAEIVHSLVQLDEALS